MSKDYRMTLHRAYTNWSRAVREIEQLDQDGKNVILETIYTEAGVTHDQLANITRILFNARVKAECDYLASQFKAQETACATQPAQS